MPFTPFHLGPGAAFKAIGGKHFSFMVFGGAQVLMDIEPLVGILRNSDVLHGYTHTLAGAAVIGIIAGVVGKPVGEYSLDLFKVPRYPLSWLASFAAAFVGTFSHIVLDAMMHADMHPWWPIDDKNGLLGVLTIDQLHVVCLALGVVGAIVVAVRFFTNGRA